MSVSRATPSVHVTTLAPKKGQAQKHNPRSHYSISLRILLWKSSSPHYFPHTERLGSLTCIMPFKKVYSLRSQWRQCCIASQHSDIWNTSGWPRYQIKVHIHPQHLVGHPHGQLQTKDWPTTSFLPKKKSITWTSYAPQQRSLSDNTDILIIIIHFRKNSCMHCIFCHNENTLLHKNTYISST